MTNTIANLQPNVKAIISAADSVTNADITCATLKLPAYNKKNLDNLKTF